MQPLLEQISLLVGEEYLVTDVKQVQVRGQTAIPGGAAGAGLCLSGR